MRYIILCVFSLFCFALYGQQKNASLISGEFSNLKMEQFVQQIENKTNYHFYYDPGQFDSLQINISVKEQPLQKVLELARPEDVIYEAIGHCYDKMGNFPQARFNYKKAAHLNHNDSQLHYKIACTYMNESNWASAVKNLEIALRMHRLQPEYNLALGQCFMEMGKLEDAITYFGNVVRVRPKNLNGWTELLKCLYKAALFEDALEYAGFAYEQTDGKPVFLFYKSAILFAMGKSKEAILQLEAGMDKNPKLIKKLISVKSENILSNNVYVLNYYLNFRKNSGSEIVNSKDKISRTHFIIAYFSKEQSHVFSNVTDLSQDIRTGQILYQGKEGIIIKR